MGSAPGGARRLPRRGASAVVLLAVVALLLTVGSAPGAAGKGYPPLPLALDRAFLGNLSSPTFGPGSSGSISFTVEDPLPSALQAVVVSFGVYAFNGFPGNATAFVPVAGAPVLTTPTSSGPTASVSVGAIAPGPTGTYRGSVGVVTSASTPSGAFAVRTSVNFSLASNGTGYRLASRGWFNATTWAAATELPNGSTTLNLSVLGVSGIVPETTVYVANSAPYDWLLGGLAVGGILLVGAGAFVYFRRGPGSRSGTR